MLSGPPLAGYLHDVFNAYPPIFVLIAISTLLTAVLLFLSQNLQEVEDDAISGDVDTGQSSDQGCWSSTRKCFVIEFLINFCSDSMI